MTGIEPQLLTALEDAVRADPGAACFAALAEAYRRAGRLAESEEVARQGLEHKPDGREGRLVLALTLLDQGRVDQARNELERLARPVLVGHDVRVPARAREPLSESELDDAFARAETDTDELIDPNRVAEEAVAHVDAGASDGLDEGADDAGASDALGEGADDGLEPPFATATMAQLLEAQGDERGARRIRSSLEAGHPETPSASPPDPAAAAPAAREESRRARQIATLERWLAKLRGDRS